MSSAKQNIIIIGGSYGGISTAHYLLKHVMPKLPDPQTYQVILISSSAEVLCRPACPRAMISNDMFPQHKLFVSISENFASYSKDIFRFIHATVTRLDLKARKVIYTRAERTTEQLGFLAVVIATGSSTPSPLFTLTDSSQLRGDWTEFREALATAQSIVIAGAGPVGIETAGELGEYLNGRPGRFFPSKNGSPKVSISVISSTPQVLPYLGAHTGLRAEKYLENVGVQVIKSTRVTDVTYTDPSKPISSPAMISLSQGDPIAADLYIPATGEHTPNLSFLTDEFWAGQKRMETRTMRVRDLRAENDPYARIYAIGDCAQHHRPAIHLIFDAVPVLCANLKRDLLLAAGKQESEVGEEKGYKEDKRTTQMVPIGRSAGVGSMMGYRLPSWLVWLIKGRDYMLWTTGWVWGGSMFSKESSVPDLKDISY
jgi:apoptosis-inducing factor 2